VPRPGRATIDACELFRGPAVEAQRTVKMQRAPKVQQYPLGPGWVRSEPMQRYYGVARGRRVGIYTSSPAAERQVYRYSWDKHESFGDLDRALSCLIEHQIQTGRASNIAQYSDDEVEVAQWIYTTSITGEVSLQNWSQVL
jgi:hypothetical protein